MNTIILVIIQPKKAFQNLKKDTDFSYINLLILLSFVFINFILMLPVSNQIMNIATSAMFFPEEQRDATMRIFHKLKYVQAAGVLISYVLKLFVSALILYILLFLSKKRINYKKVLELIIHCSFIVVIGSFINTGLIYFKGIETIQSIYDTYLTGFNVLISNDKEGGLFYSILVNVSVFQVYFVVLLSLGLKIILDMSLNRSTIISLVFWILTIIPSVVSVNFTDSLNLFN